jgi:hypothetical protein
MSENERLKEHRLFKADWKNWGPYLSERAWGTVREDYSESGDAWRYFPHDHAYSRTYRWNEDGIAGISDRNQFLCFSVALWNGADSILKERMFGLTSHEGNHGEDVKEYYFYLDNTPTHSYMKMLYKYPQSAFPYEKLVEENGKRGYQDFEYELIDTGIFDNDDYFDIFIEYAKAEENDILVEISIYNRAEHAANCYLLPTLWFRNTWSWGYPEGPMGDVPSKPLISQLSLNCLKADHPKLGSYYLYTENQPEFIFTENETNFEHLFNKPNPSPYVKDAFHRYLIHHEVEAVNPRKEGTKAAAVSAYTIPAHSKAVVKMRLSQAEMERPFDDFGSVFKRRQEEADAFYAGVQRSDLGEDEKRVQRQAFAGLLWSKQLYYYDIEHWLKGDAAPHSVSPQRHEVRNAGWKHLVNFDIISMPDKWEYPWYASWDLAFHCIALVLVDPDFAKRQLILMTREWYMHPNGQLPAYEWNFVDVNPPVQAWAALRVYQIEAKINGKPDIDFLKGIFHKLLLNFTWWVNRKDAEGNNVFQGGFLGLDNISIFDRSKPLPTGGHIDQADGTAWMGFYCVEMMKIALELSKSDPVYQDTATKFFEHFQRISMAIFNMGDSGVSLWDEEDGFFYDILHMPDGKVCPLKVRSLVGFLSLFAVEVLDPPIFKAAPIFDRRISWFTKRHPPKPDPCMACIFHPGIENRRQMAIVTGEKLVRILKYLFDENEFLSPYGIRSLSKYHQDHPYAFQSMGMEWNISYQPAESNNGLFGGNSNWRGPIWFPINYLLIEALQRYHHYYGDTLLVEFPTGSGIKKDLKEIAKELSQRLINIFIQDKKGRRPVFGGVEKFQTDPHWKDYILFYEYFHGENGAGIGASHQTGWTGIIAKLIQQC